MTDSIQKIPSQELTRGKKLGEGGFGVVYQGQWQGEKVAIKTLRMTTLSPQEKLDFIQEAAANQGDSEAHRRLGYCFENGEGVSKNQYQAFKHYKLAADRGDAPAQFETARRYRLGEGVEKDARKALKYFQMAESQGYKGAREAVRSVKNEFWL